MDKFVRERLALALLVYQTRCHPGLDPGPISRCCHSRKVDGVGRPGGVGRDLGMGPGLRRGDTVGGAGWEEAIRNRLRTIVARL